MALTTLDPAPEAAIHAAEGTEARHWLRSLPLPIALFTVTMFVASGLLFLVQPMFARMVLPRVGGSPAAWNACVLFFQTALLLGYLYAHLSTRWLGLRRQTALHAMVLLVPLLFLPLSAGDGTPRTGESPVWWILQTMAVHIGVPFFVLATSAPLLQRWFAALPLPSARDPYFLYSASNLGSMLALLGYPFLIEPALGLQEQALVWTSGYMLLVVLTGLCLWTTRRPEPVAETVGVAPLDGDAAAPDAIARARWTILAFAPSSLMLGVTVQISTDVAAVPLMWVLPLALYLLTFVVAFSGRGDALYRWSVGAASPLILVCVLSLAVNAHAWWFMALHLFTFLCCAMACHRRLADHRPRVRYLTEFYLWISFGGMLGGVFNTLVAPHIFSTVLEYPLVLLLTGFLIARAQPGRPTSYRPAAVGYAVIVTCMAAWILGQPSAEVVRGLVAVMAGVAVTLVMINGPATLRGLLVPVGVLVLWAPPVAGGSVLYSDRSFFGVMRVIESPDRTYRTLRHGSTTHGWQRVPAEGRCEPSSYFHPDGPVGDIVESFGPRLNTVAIIGLGTGAMGCYAETDQHWTFFEIDPLVERIARDSSLFVHLQNARAPVRVEIGDGRLRLQAEPAGRFDLIVLDAFSSDSVPVHLLTQEALRLYLSRVTDDGLVAMHISNRYLSLEPVIATLAEREGVFATAKFDAETSGALRAAGKVPSHWVVLSRHEPNVELLKARLQWRDLTTERQMLWTDDYSNIFWALR